ncbi:MAG: ACT domain-containing protein [Solirubrobacterales bacterium]|nr:ACT domain-containing protein [Solirubrobacterales bacterium]
MPSNELTSLLADLRPQKLPGSFVFVELPEALPDRLEPLATVRESEGLSAVVDRSDADRLGLDYDWVAGWITLRVESALSAVGLTAAVSTCLTGRGISCNVIAGLRHDHLLVPIERTDDALAALNELASSERD